MMRLLCALLCLLLSSSPLSAEEVVFYRCTDAAGALTLQNMPCPKGSREEKKLMQPVNTVPMSAASKGPTAPAVTPMLANLDPTLSAVPATDPAAAASVQAPRTDTSLLPPPKLFQCTTHDRDTYITENAEPQSRCVAMRTVGLDGNPNTGAGQACEVVRDTCARVPDEDLCSAWTKRLGETEVAWRFARPDNAAANQADHLRVQRILAETSCSEERGS